MNRYDEQGRERHSGPDGRAGASRGGNGGGGPRGTSREVPHGRLKYTPRAPRSSSGAPASERRRVRATSSPDAGAYSRDRYVHRPARTEDSEGGSVRPSSPCRHEAGPDVSHRPEPRPAARYGRARAADVADEFSRERAQTRYAGHEHHVSKGGPGALERLRDGGAAVLGHKRILLAVLVAIVALLLIGAIVWYVQVSNAMKPSEDVSSAVAAETPGRPYYVLLLGSDKRPNEADVARADSIMLCRVDEGAKKVTMVSLPRDLRVQIAGQGYGKLNSALTYNGFSGMIGAASEVAGVPISYYAVMYFSGFKQLVDDLGGVEVDVPAGTYYHGTWVNKGKEGKNVHINGKQALVLARCRHGNPPDQGAYAAGDYQRTKNQRNLMKAIVRKIMKQPVVAVPGQVLSVAQCIETNMPASKLALVALAMRGIDSDKDMYSATAPATSQYINGVSYQILDDASWQQMKARMEAGEDPNG